MKSGINNSGKKPEMVHRGTKKAPEIFKALGNLLWGRRKRQLVCKFLVKVAPQGIFPSLGGYTLYFPKSSGDRFVR